MINDSYVYFIVALLPLSAFMVTIQANPFNALVIRGILGAIAALVYSVLGAPDVALTEALVGTMLAITLYAVAVRSSLVMRMGVLQKGCLDLEEKHEGQMNDSLFAPLIADLRTITRKYHLRLELIPYPDSESLTQALLEKEIHVTCIAQLQPDQDPTQYQTVTRIRRLYEILQTELTSPITSLDYISASDLEEKH
ncbi:DUF4040 domain-containing protein [Phormidesmis sp. 146-12]